MTTAVQTPHPKGGVWIQRKCHPDAAEQAWYIRAEDKPIADKHSVDNPFRTIQDSGSKGQRIQILQSASHVEILHPMPHMHWGHLERRLLVIL